MTNYNDFSDLDLTDEAAMTKRMEETDEKLDSIPLSNVVMIVCDYLDVDPIETVKNIAGPQGKIPTLTGGEGVIRDIIVSSQSNYERSVWALLEVLTLDQKISDLGMTGG